MASMKLKGSYRSQIQKELQLLRSQPSDRAFRELGHLLEKEDGPWPYPDLVGCYQTLWRDLAEAIRDGEDHSWNARIGRTRGRIKHVTPWMSDLIASDLSQPALIEPESRKEISYTRVREFVDAFDLGLQRSDGKPRVVVVLPNGPFLALAALAVANRYTFVPMANAAAPAQLKKDMETVDADAVLILDHDLGKLDSTMDVPVFAVRFQDDLTFTASRVNGSDTAEGTTRVPPNGPDDLAMILFTSGTSGRKKLVPITIMNLLSSAILTRDSLGLGRTSRCLNMMPLHHVGGLIRSVWASICAGGTVVCCPSFDPSLFWTAVRDWQPTWYYATPTMHQMILAQAKQYGDIVHPSSIHFVCNAGGGIPPTLAAQLQKTFQCNVLPSYGMTECTPITAPPSSYNLERVGSSGLPVGPDLGILDINGSTQRAPVGTIGRICVRGLPVFSGYLTTHGIDNSCFDALGWFDTGDLGYIDEAGYLYITGRSKEVINRGGEIISPLEVEDALLSAAADTLSLLFGRITETLAFSMPHEVLQEVVGVVIVTSPGEPRPDLRQIQEGLKNRLEQPKWPAIVVYMDQLPRIGNKLCRVGLSEQLGLEPLKDQTLAAHCHYEGRSPMSTTPARRCEIVPDMAQPYIMQICGVSDVLVRVNSVDGFLDAILFDSSVRSTPIDNMLTNLSARLDGYLVPNRINVLGKPMPTNADGTVDDAAVEAAVHAAEDAALSSTERRVCGLFSEVLQCPPANLVSSSDFFASGGDSMGAGRLTSRLRQEFSVHLPADAVLRHSTVGETSRLIEKTMMQAKPKEAIPGQYPGCRKTYSSTNPVVLILNLLPIGMFHPMLQSLHWTLFIYLMSGTSTHWPLRGSLMGRLLHIVLVRLAIKLFLGLFRPLLGIAFKWLVIGRYRAGMYQMWGPYHMRWWLTQKALQGFFNEYSWSRVLYYRALGVRIGRAVHIHELALLGEYDLITLGDNPIQIGSNSIVGLRAVLAPGCDLAPGTCLGPNTSSWETEDAGELNRVYASTEIPRPSWIWYLLVVEPLHLLVGFISRLPSLAGTLPIVSHYPNVTEQDAFKRQVLWFTNLTRIGQFILVKVYGAVVGPFAWILAVLLVKRGLDLFCGRPQPGPYRRMSGRQKLRSAVLRRVFPRGDLGPLTGIIGTHYEAFSIIVRMLGARVGKRVYWPTTALTMIEDYDLLEVGNDVVFGSRSSLMTADGIGRGRIVIGDGAFVGDRVVALPGVTIGTRTTIGSGASLRRDAEYPDDTTWAGSRHGDAIQFPQLKSRRNHRQRTAETPDEKKPSDDDTISPFGRAFYEGQANYHVLGMGPIVGYSTLMAIVTAVFPSVTILTSLLAVARLLRIDFSGLEASWWRPLSFYGLFTLVAAIMTLLQSLAVVGFTIATKWTLLGRRKPGYYPWDTSSYCQRWQITRTLEKLLDDYPGGLGVLTLISGTAYLPMFYRAMGATVGKDCALAADGQPNILWTEPDLVTFGDRVASDDASVVCHLNTRGEFEMNTLRVGDRSVLRAGSRLLSGASMGDDACLLEHTLVLSGDHVGDGCTVQGWPCEPFSGDRLGGLVA